MKIGVILFVSFLTITVSAPLQENGQNNGEVAEKSDGDQGAQSGTQSGGAVSQTGSGNSQGITNMTLEERVALVESQMMTNAVKMNQFNNHILFFIGYMFHHLNWSAFELLPRPTENENEQEVETETEAETEMAADLTFTNNNHSADAISETVTLLDKTTADKSTSKITLVKTTAGQLTNANTLDQGADPINLPPSNHRSSSTHQGVLSDEQASIERAINRMFSNHPADSASFGASLEDLAEKHGLIQKFPHLFGNTSSRVQQTNVTNTSIHSTASPNIAEGSKTQKPQNNEEIEKLSKNFEVTEKSIKVENNENEITTKSIKTEEQIPNAETENGGEQNEPIEKISSDNTVSEKEPMSPPSTDFNENENNVAQENDVPLKKSDKEILNEEHPELETEGPQNEGRQDETGSDNENVQAAFDGESMHHSEDGESPYEYPPMMLVPSEVDDN